MFNPGYELQGRPDLGIFFQVMPVRRLGLDCHVATVYVGDPNSDHAQVDSAIHMSSQLATKWAWAATGRIVQLAETVVREDEQAQMIAASAGIPPVETEDVLE